MNKMPSRSRNSLATVFRPNPKGMSNPTNPSLITPAFPPNPLHAYKKIMITPLSHPAHEKKKIIVHPYARLDH